MNQQAAPNNRAQRRNTNRGSISRRKPVIAGSLLTVGGILGAYLGYVRPPAAFAVSCTATFTPDGSGDSAALESAITTAGDAAGDAGTVCITGDVILDADVTITSSVTLIGDMGGARPVITATGTTNNFKVLWPNSVPGLYSLSIENLDFAMGTSNMIDMDYGNRNTNHSATISNCDFSGGGGAYAIDAYGGGTLQVSNVQITGSKGIFAAYTDTTLNDVNITDSSMALYAKYAPSMMLTDVNILNVATVLSTGIESYKSPNITLDNVNITNFSAGLVARETIDVTVRNSTFDDVDSALYIESYDSDSTTITDSTFTNNSNLGGSSYPIFIKYGDVTMSGVTFSNNSRVSSGNVTGMVYLLDNAAVEIDGSHFTGNSFTKTTDGQGNLAGVVHVQSATSLTMGASAPNTFSGNGSATYSFVSSLYIKNTPTINVSNTTFAGNTNTKSAMYVGAASRAPTGTITGSTFTNNTSSGSNSDLMFKDPEPGLTISSSRFSSRRALNAKALASLGSDNTFSDEIPEGGGDSGSGGGSTPVASDPTPTPTAEPSTPVQEPATTPAPTPAPVTFTDPGEVVPAEVSVLTPAQVASIPYEQFKDLTPEVFGVLTAEQVSELPIDLVRAIRPARLAALEPAAVSGMSGEQLSSLRLASMRAMSPEQVQAISAEAMTQIAPVFLAQLKPKVLAALDTDVLAALSPQQAAAIRPAALAKLPIASLRALAPESFGALSARQLAKLTTRQVARLTTQQLAVLTPAQRRSLRRG